MVVEVVFVDELLRDVRQFDSGILWPIQWRAKVEVFYVETKKNGTTAIEDTVDN